MILVVDDNARFRESARFLLESYGYSVRTAPDGLAAIALLREQPADLLITDIQMDGMSGWELARAARATLPIHIIAVSGVEDATASRHAAVDAFVEKPFHPVHLVDQVRRLIGPARTAN